MAANQPAGALTTSTRDFFSFVLFLLFSPPTLFVVVVVVVVRTSERNCNVYNGDTQGEVINFVFHPLAIV